MTKLRVSIALATFQGEAFLAEQLWSYLDQTRLPDELVVSDDGSSDGTVRVIEEFRRVAPFPLKLIATVDRLGVNQNFERAAMNCTGEIILFSDQDDVWLPRHIEALTYPLENNPEIMAVASNSTCVTKDMVPTGVDLQRSQRFSNRERNVTMRLRRNQIESVLRHRIAFGHGMAFRGSILPVVVPFLPHRVYDQWVFILAATAGFVTYATEPLTLHRQHGRQAAGDRRRELRHLAEGSANFSEQDEKNDAEQWNELLTRVRERRSLIRDPDSVEYVLREKLEFVLRRSQIRIANLPTRVVLTARELFAGRYHRWGRGILTLGRDLYGRRV